MAEKEPKWDDTDPVFEDTTEIPSAEQPAEEIVLPELPDNNDSSILQKAEGALIGGAVGGISGLGSKKLGDLLQSVSDDWRYDKLASGAPTQSGSFVEDILRQGGEDSSFITKKDVGRFAKEHGIGSLGQSEEKTAKLAHDAARKAGKSQSDFVSKLDKLENAPKIAKKDLYKKMLEEYRKQIGETEGSGAYNELNAKYAEAPGQPIELPKSLSANELEKSSIPFERDAERSLQQGRNIRSSAIRGATEDAIQGMDNGEALLDQFKTLKQGTAKGKILEELAIEAGKKAKPIANTVRGGVDSILGKLMGGGLNLAKNVTEPILDTTGKVLSKGAKYMGPIGALLGAGIGAASAEEGHRLQGAASGAADAVNPLSMVMGDLANSESITSEDRRQMREESLRKNAAKGAEDLQAITSKNDYTPDELQMMSERMLAHKGGESYANVLNQAISAPERTRKTILFGLNQQPAFRELLRKMQNNE